MSNVQPQLRMLTASAREEVLRERAAELRELFRVQFNSLDGLLHGVHCSRVLVRREELAHLCHAVHVHKSAHQRLNKFIAIRVQYMYE